MMIKMLATLGLVSAKRYLTADGIFAPEFDYRFFEGQNPLTDYGYYELDHSENLIKIRQIVQFPQVADPTDQSTVR